MKSSESHEDLAVQLNSKWPESGGCKLAYMLYPEKIDVELDLQITFKQSIENIINLLFTQAEKSKLQNIVPETAGMLLSIGGGGGRQLLAIFILVLCDWSFDLVGLRQFVWTGRD